MDLNAFRGKGLGSRMLVSGSDLPEGWTFERKSDRYCVWIDDKGRRYKSSKEVAAALKAREQASGSEYEVGTEIETEIDTSESDTSPLKRPRVVPWYDYL